jgi:hypothetical protein
LNETFAFFALVVVVLALLVYGVLPVFTPKRAKHVPVTVEPVLEETPPAPPAEHQAPLVPVTPELSPVINIPISKPKPIPPPPPQSSTNQPEKLEELGGLPPFDGLCVACRVNPMDPMKTTFLCVPCGNLTDFSFLETDHSVTTPEIELPPATDTPAITRVTTSPEEIQEPHDDEIQEIPIISSTIRGVWYYPEHKVLHIRLTDGSIYRYFMVPEEVFNDFLTADSKDAYFQSHIRTYHNKRDKAPTAPQNKAPKANPKKGTEPDVRPGLYANQPDRPRAVKNHNPSPDFGGMCNNCGKRPKVPGNDGFCAQCSELT